MTAATDDAPIVSPRKNAPKPPPTTDERAIASVKEDVATAKARSESFERELDEAKRQGQQELVDEYKVERDFWQKRMKVLDAGVAAYTPSLKGVSAAR